MISVKHLAEFLACSKSETPDNNYYYDLMLLPWWVFLKSALGLNSSEETQAGSPSGHSNGLFSSIVW